MSQPNRPTSARRRGASDEGRAAVRRAFGPGYGRELSEDEVTEIADNLRRFFDVLQRWKQEDLGLLPRRDPSAEPE